MTFVFQFLIPKQEGGETIRHHVIIKKAVSFVKSWFTGTEMAAQTAFYPEETVLLRNDEA